MSTSELEPEELPELEPESTDEEPRCTVCGEVAAYDENDLMGDGRLVRRMRHGTLFDYAGTGDGPLCMEHYEQTSTYQLEMAGERE